MELPIELIKPISFYLIVFGIPFCYVFYTNKFGKGIFLAWGLLILCVVVFRVYPGLFGVGPFIWDYDRGTRVFTPIMFGWVPACIISFVAAIIRRAIIYFRPSAFLRKNDKKNAINVSQIE